MLSVIQLVAAEDDPGLPDCLREQFESAPDSATTQVVSDGWEIIAAMSRLNPNILIFDLDLLGISGLAILQAIRWCSPKTQVLVLSSHDEEATIVEVLELGARGYVVKGNGADLGKAIRALQRGELWVRRRDMARVLDRLVNRAGLNLSSN